MTALLLEHVMCKVIGKAAACLVFNVMTIIVSVQVEAGQRMGSRFQKEKSNWGVKALKQSKT